METPSLFSTGLKTLFSISGASIAIFMAPVIPYGWVCTSMVLADFISARMLACRIRRKLRSPTVTETTKFSSRRFGAVLTSLAKIYAFLLLAHGVDIVIIGPENSFCILRFAAALVCFWQFWSILENEASANGAPWARIAQRILIDKTERHLGIELTELKHHNKVDKT